MNSTICSAIENKRVISFYYDGGIRIVEPFCHGVSTAGHEVLRGYQIGGYSKSASEPPWRLYLVSKMSSLEITDQSFNGIRPEYNPNDSMMSTIYCRV